MRERGVHSIVPLTTPEARGSRVGHEPKGEFSGTVAQARVCPTGPTSENVVPEWQPGAHGRLLSYGPNGIESDPTCAAGEVSQ